MKRNSKSRMILRKLSVFYLFLTLLIALLLIFFYGIVPANQIELNTRAHRVLNQLAANILQKEREAESLFTPADSSQTKLLWQNIVSHTQNFRNLDHLPYTADTVRKSEYNPIQPKSGSYFEIGKNGLWEWAFRAIRKPDSMLKRPDSMVLTVHINIHDFIHPILDSRTDIFDTYVLCIDSSALVKNKNIPIIFSKDEQTESYFLNTDTLTSLQRNTDGSATGSISLGGHDYKIFYAPFQSATQKLLLGGLLDTREYGRRTRLTPINFIPICIIITVLLLLAMPFIKIFLLDRKETLTRQDVALTGFSFYLGPVCVCLILLYTFSNIINVKRSSEQLHQFGQELRISVENDIAASRKRLLKYDSAVCQMKGENAELKRCLSQPADARKGMSKVDSIMGSICDNHTSRVFWIDSVGNTLAKWNPFHFIAPLTDVSGYEYFKKFMELHPASVPNADSFCLVYAGKSNVTGEFQGFVLKPSRQKFCAREDCQVNILTSVAIAEAIDFDISEHAVFPDGFGFCLADKKGNILVDSDPNLNLSANILKESGQNSLLSEAILGKDPGDDINIELYGQPHSAQVFAIAGQSLYIVAYYNEKTRSHNVVRLLLFSIQTYAWLAIIIFLCIVLSTFQKVSKGRLLFRLGTIEWIRPAADNKDSYVFTFYYFGSLIATYIVFLLILFITQELNSLFYISLLLPFYAIWGFVVSRSRMQFPSSPGNILIHLFNAGIYPAIFTASAGLFLWYALGRPEWIYGFHIICFLLLWLLSVYLPRMRFLRLPKLRKYQQSYQISLMLSMFLLSLLPITGLFLYGNAAEKLQHKKQDLLVYARKASDWQAFIHDVQSVGYKDTVIAILGKKIYQHKVFLLNGDSISTKAGQAIPKNAGPLPDNMYAHLINEANIVGGVDNGLLAIGDTANDGSWQFILVRSPFTGQSELELYYRGRQSASSQPAIIVKGELTSLVSELFKKYIAVILFAFVLIILIIRLSSEIVKITLRRLFLRNIINRANIRVDKHYIWSRINDQPTNTPFLADLTIDLPIEPGFFKTEMDFPQPLGTKPAFSQEEYIVALSQSFSNAYELIWKELSLNEQFVLYDFCRDYYTNYKNLDIFISLIHKGIVCQEPKSETWSVFSMSFRQFILSKGASKEISKLYAVYKIGGMWKAFKIPLLSVIAVIGIIIFATQSEVSHQIIAVITSVTALFPLVLNLFNKSPVEKKT